MIINFGYLDPGTGSFFLQVIVGAILGGMVFFRSAIIRIIAKLKPSRKQTVAPDESEE